LLPGNEQTAYDFIRNHHRQYRELPQPSLLRDELSITLPRSPESIEFYLNAVDDRYTFNQVRTHYESLRASMQTADVAAISDTVRQMHAVTASTGRRNRDVSNIGDAMGLVLARIEDTRGLGGITGIETGWPRYDAITGGYQDADIITFVARPAVGKTYVLLVQAWRAYLSGKNVLYVTTEMNTEQSGRRLISIGTGVDPTRLKMNMLSTHVERRIRSFVTDLQGIDRFRIFSVGMKSRLADTEALIAEFQPDIVYIDGVYLLQPSAKGAMKRVERVGEVFDELKALNLSVNIPFVVSTQFNRQSGKNGVEGSLETIGFSDAIGTHSSVVVAIKHGPTENPMASRDLEFMKGRDGESGAIGINFKFAPLNFDELELDERTGAPVTSDPTTGDPLDSTDWMV